MKFSQLEVHHATSDSELFWVHLNTQISHHHFIQVSKLQSNTIQLVNGLSHFNPITTSYIPGAGCRNHPPVPGTRCQAPLSTVLASGLRPFSQWGWGSLGRKVYGTAFIHHTLHRPYIGLIYGRYLKFRILKWPLIISPSQYSDTVMYCVYRCLQYVRSGSTSNLGMLCSGLQYVRHRWALIPGRTEAEEISQFPGSNFLIGLPINKGAVAVWGAPLVFSAFWCVIPKQMISDKRLQWGLCNHRFDSGAALSTAALKTLPFCHEKTVW